MSGACMCVSVRLDVSVRVCVCAFVRECMRVLAQTSDCAAMYSNVFLSTHCFSGNIKAKEITEITLSSTPLFCQTSMFSI